MKLLATIFDLDGTIIEDDKEYEYAFKKVLESLGIKVEKLELVGGIGVKNEWPVLLKNYKIDTYRDLDDLTVLTQKYFLEKIDKIRLKDGIIQLVDGLKEAKVLIALATSNSWNVVDRVLEKFSLSETFDAITTIEEVLYPKPDPELFEKTAEKLGVAANACVVFEDTKTGIQAAMGANMKVIGVSRNKEHARKLAGADIIIEGYNNLTVEKLENLFEV